MTTRRRLALWIQSLNLSDNQAALRLGVSRFTMSRWLSGQRRPSLAYRPTIERIVGIPAVDWQSAAERKLAARLARVSA